MFGAGVVVNKFEETRTNTFPDKMTIGVDMFGALFASWMLPLSNGLVFSLCGRESINSLLLGFPRYHGVM